jgi:serine protease SohB
MFKAQSEPSIEINKLNEQYEKMKSEVEQHLEKSISPLSSIKNLAKKQISKKLQKKSNVFVLDFKGDKYASQVGSLAKEISAIISTANKGDEVIIRLHSGGGTVTGYGLATTELKRLKPKGLFLTVCIDEVAASGGYMMASVADKIIASPFACIGSIGVVMEMPNFYELFEKVGVKYLQFTAGKHKRTVSMGAKPDVEGKAQLQSDIDDIHELFKNHIKEGRPKVDIEKVSEGQIWNGILALEQKLVDELDTSENVIFEACKTKDVFHIAWVAPRTLMNKLSLAAESSIINIITSIPTKPTRLLV